MELLLPYRPPSAWPLLCRFLARRAIAGVEEVEGNHYRRTICVSHNGSQLDGWLTLSPAADATAMRLALSPALEPVADEMAARVRFFAGLDIDPRPICQALGDLSKGHPGIRVPGAIDGFEVAVRAILGQQITVAAATTLAGRVATLGAPVTTPFTALTHHFPSAAVLAATRADTLGRMGVIGARIRAIQALASACASGEIVLSPGVDVAPTIKALLALPGIGDWTAQYIAMRTLGWADAFPASDHGVLTALEVKKPREAKTLAEKWRPYRAYAVMQLWHR